MIVDFRFLKQKISNALMYAQMGDGKRAMDEVQELQETKNGFAAILIGSIMAVVIGAIMLYIGVFVTATVSSSIPTGSLTAADNTTLASVRSNVNTAFTILGIILIVGGAGGIIATLMGFTGGTRQ